MEGLSRAELEELRQALLLGTARRSLALPLSLAAAIAAAPDRPDPALPVLALVGQHRRFERPHVAGLRETPKTALRLHADARAILAARVRRMLMRLVDVAGKSISAMIVPAAARRIEAFGYRLHPFAPAAANAREQQAAAQRLFENLSLPRLVAQTKLSSHALLAALPEDDLVFWALHATAVSEGDAGTLMVLTEHKLTESRAYPSFPTVARLAESCAAPISGEMATALLASST
jgi:hypothetical protein